MFRRFRSVVSAALVVWYVVSFFVVSGCSFNSTCLSFRLIFYQVYIQCSLQKLTFKPCNGMLRLQFCYPASQARKSTVKAANPYREVWSKHAAGTPPKNDRNIEIGNRFSPNYMKTNTHLITIEQKLVKIVRHRTVFAWERGRECECVPAGIQAENFSGKKCLIGWNFTTWLRGCDIAQIWSVPNRSLTQSSSRLFGQKLVTRRRDSGDFERN